MSAVSEITEKWINRYVEIQNTLNSNDPIKELEFQLKVAKTQLEALGIPTEDLTRSRS